MSNTTFPAVSNHAPNGVGSSVPEARVPTGQLTDDPLSAAPAERGNIRIGHTRFPRQPGQPLHALEYARTGLIEQIMALHGRAMPDPRAYRTRLEEMPFEKLSELHRAQLGEFES